jgi:hypothetical protein
MEMKVARKFAILALCGFAAFCARGSLAATVAAPTFNPNGGTHNDSVEVTISTTTPGATIYYTMDGTSPTVDDGIEYDPDLPLELDETTTVKAFAVNAGDTDSTIASATFTIVDTTPAITVAAPVFNPPAGTFNDTVQVAITCPTVGATIYYTTDGTDPTVDNGDIYDPDFPLDFTQTTMLKAFAVKDSDDTDSTITSGTYTVVDTSPPITIATPIFSPVAGTYNDIVHVTISSTTPDAVIHYTTNGTDPTAASPEFDPFSTLDLTATTTVKAIALRLNDFDSAIATATYTIIDNPPITVAAPTFSPKPGRYFDFVEVSLSTTTPGATIYYTIDGTDPIVDPAYEYFPEFPEFVIETTTIKAIAVRAGDNNSSISSATFKILPLPPPKLKVIGPKAFNVTKPTVIIRGTSTFADEIDYQIGKIKAVKKAKGTDKWKIKAKVKPGLNVIGIFGVGTYENSKPIKIKVNYVPPA